MAYYKRKYWPRKCGSCEKTATHEVRGHRNELYGKYCEKCADMFIALKENQEVKK